MQLQQLVGARLTQNCQPKSLLLASPRGWGLLTARQLRSKRARLKLSPLYQGCLRFLFTEIALLEPAQIQGEASRPHLLMGGVSSKNT